MPYRDVGGFIAARDEWPVAALLEHLDEEMGEAELRDVAWDRAHSNDVFELRFTDGRSLMVKHAKHDWARDRFEASRRAAALLRNETDVVAPSPIRLPDDLGERPLQAYWRIDLPTLDNVWEGLTSESRSAAMASLGALLERLHDVRVPGWGQLAGERGGDDGALRSFLEWDIGQRLLPAARGVWPDAVPALKGLLERIPELCVRIGGRPATLAHNDMHMGNILCRVEGAEVSCVGLLDLDSAVAVPPESDAASLDVLHGPHFEQHLPQRWRDRVWEGYGRSLDAWAIVFFRGLHLANLGFYSALVGHQQHAHWIAEVLDREVERLSIGSHGGPSGPTPDA